MPKILAGGPSNTVRLFAGFGRSYRLAMTTISRSWENFYSGVTDDGFAVPLNPANPSPLESDETPNEFKIEIYMTALSRNFISLDVNSLQSHQLNG